MMNAVARLPWMIQYLLTCTGVNDSTPFPEEGSRAPAFCALVQSSKFNLQKPALTNLDV